ncbi:hypothetical protein SAMN05421505_12369 [Sinosporangium album]|uniref:Glycolipid-binding n=1 Tax=Sinosporangium album TaxID=504805 RepID=A0A1G8FGW6_9ACTN|nr:putative glycolipid-binding domain-containing protein [Sinosporangium album]SDH81345.1 hypothetical protein SAMN05421505_12369 [Sinosporangium album]
MRSLVWMKEAGAEYADVELIEGLSATGVAIGAEPMPYRLEYSLRTFPDLTTEALTAWSSGEGWWRSLELRRSADGRWSCEAQADGELEEPLPGGEPRRFADALDCDLGLSPLTNTMPVLRHHLLKVPGRVDFVMAWVSMPYLSVVRDEQRYTHVRPGHVRYESEGFEAELSFSSDGFVADYPGLARCVP